MNSNCERIRRRALEHGEGSVEYSVWVRHSLHCDECRSEVYIQSLLRRDTGSENVGLSSEAVSRLVQLADERYRGGRRRHERFLRLVLGWGVRAAVFCVLLYGLALLRPRLFEFEEGSGVSRGSTPSVQSVGRSRGVLASTSGVSSALPLSSGAVESPSVAEFGGVEMNQAMLGLSDGCLADVLESREALERARAYSHDPEMLPGWSFERRLQSCRERIGVQRDFLYGSLDGDTWLEFDR